MKIALEREVDPAAWALLAQGDDDGTFFHDPTWMHALTATYPGFQARYVVAREDNGRLAGGLPAVAAVRAGLTQLLSMPFGTYAMPLVAGGASQSPARVRALLGEAWRREATRSGVVRAHLVPFSTTQRDPGAAWLPAAWRRVERTHIIPLAVGFEEIWFKRYDKENRTASRKAVRLGVVVGEERGAAAGETLDRLYRTQSMEWSDHAAYRPGLLQRLAETGGERVRVWVARHEGEAVFAAMVFYHRDTVTPWVSGSTAGARALCAGNLLHKVIIEDACRRGFAAYNFGGSGGIAGIEAFKVAFGGEAVDYASYLREAPWFGGLRRLATRLKGAR